MRQPRFVRALAVLAAALAAAAGCAEDGPATAAPASAPPTVDALRVPTEYGTIQAAVDAAEPGDLVLIAPGEYAESVVVKTPRIVIRGEDRSTTVLDGDGQLGDAILVTADGVAVENLTIREYSGNAVLWTGVDGYRGSYLTMYRLGAYGLYAIESVDGLMEHAYGSGAADSAFYVGRCDDCRVVITDVIGERSAAGYSGTNSRGDVYVVRSTFRDNRVGVILPTFGTDTQRETTVAGNLVTGSGHLGAPTVFHGVYDAPYGAGIVVVGGTDNTIVRNRVEASESVGIALAPNPGDDTIPTARGNTVSGNAVSGSVIADLMLLLGSVGDGNCFAGNDFETSGPAAIEQAAPCEGAPTADLAEGALDLSLFLTEHPQPDTPWMDTPEPPRQEGMPGPLAAPAAPAVDVFVAPDVDAIPLPK